jgi:hypothetical protein
MGKVAPNTPRGRKKRETLSGVLSGLAGHGREVVAAEGGRIVSRSTRSPSEHTAQIRARLEAAPDDDSVPHVPPEEDIKYLLRAVDAYTIRVAELEKDEDTWVLVARRFATHIRDHHKEDVGLDLVVDEALAILADLEECRR